MHSPYTAHHQPIPMQRGYSDPRHEPPPTAPPHSAHSTGSNQNWHQSSARYDTYAPYNQVQVQSQSSQRESEFTSYAKRRKTTSALSAPPLHHRSQLPHQLSTSYQRPGPYPYPPSPSMGGSAPLSATSSDSDSWQWSFFPDQRCEDRGSASRLAHKRSSNDLNGSAPARSTKQSSRHQRKRSAGCLNCHTVWSPTWRKDAQGAMRCNACGLYLAARGQERPVTLMPKDKGGNDEQAAIYAKQPSTPREDSRYYPSRNSSEDDYPPSSPFYPNGAAPVHSMRPSPSFSIQTLGSSSGGSSSNSLPLNESRDMLSPNHPSGYSSTSPLVSPRAFATLSLEPSRHLPYPSENTLGLKNVSRPSSAEYHRYGPESGDDNSVRVSSGNSPTLPSHNMPSSRSPHFAPTKTMPGSPRMMLPPLSELTRGLSSLRSDFQSGRHYSVSQDRKQTELFAVKC